MKYVILAWAAGLLITLAIHYPLATTWPIGGDAAATIRDATNISFDSLWQSRYPLFSIFFNISRALPLDWPAQYVWMMAAGHVAVGLALGVLLWRMSGWRSAAVGMAIWALTTTTINNHFEDGTIAQLWSLVPFLLFFERVAAGSMWGAAVTLIMTLGIHPMTGLLLIGSCLIAWPVMVKTRQWWLAGISAGATIVVIAVAVARPNLFDVLYIDTRSFSFPELIRSFFGPFVLIAPLGALIAWHRLQARLVSRWLLIGWLGLALLAISSWLAAARWQTYAVLAICMLAGLAWPHLLRVFPWRSLALAFTVTFFATVSLAAWQENARVYAHYDSPSRYARLHPQELAAIAWMKDNLPAGSFIASSQANRHTEWIPILTPHRWQGLEPEELEQLSESETYTHLLFFTKREKVPPRYVDHPDHYPIAFQNEAAVLFGLHPAPYP